MKIAFIGAGNMGKAMIGGLIKNALALPHQIVASDVAADYLRAFCADSGIRSASNNLQAALDADALILAVKPQNVPEVLSELKGQLAEKTVLISICAGVSITKLRQETGHQSIVRAMPNTPAQIGMGVCVWTAVDVSPTQKKLAHQILASLGQTYYVEIEDEVNKATALSGSGPAYLFYFIEALIEAGKNLGLSPQLAQELALNTVWGSANYAKQSSLPLSALRENVTSKGGTTEAALLSLKESNWKEALAKAVQAAYAKALELGK